MYGQITNKKVNSMKPIKLLINKRYAVIDSRTNAIIAFTHTEIEATSISSIADYYTIIEIANEITWYYNETSNPE